MDESNSGYGKGGRPPKPDKPENAGDCRKLLALEIHKETPNATRSGNLRVLLESYEHQENNQLISITRELAQSQADNAALQTEITSLRESLAASEAKCTALAVPHDEVARVNQACASLRQDITRANTDRDAAVRIKDEAVALRDAAIESQRTAEQGERQARDYVTGEFTRIIDHLENAARAVGAAPQARELWHAFTFWAQELRRTHAEAIARPVAPVPAPVKIIQTLSPEKLRAAREALEEQARVENEKEQGRPVDLSKYAYRCEKFIPRAAEPEPVRAITGAAYEL